MISACPGARQAGARLAIAFLRQLPGRHALTSSTPDALWSSRSVRLLRPAAIDVHELRADGRIRGAALRGVNLSVPVGARLLLVARPEESASLMLRVLAGLVRPRRGRIALAGVTRADDSARGWSRRVGYVGPQPAIYPWLRPAEALDLAARLAGFDSGEARLRVGEMIDHLDIGDAASIPLSRTGPMVAQKTALGATLLTDPEVLLLDEPLRSVDPDERTRLLDLRPRRLTVVLASRYPASEEGLVNQVALIRDGRIALHTSVADLQANGLPLSGRGIESLAERVGFPTGQPSSGESPRAVTST